MEDGRHSPPRELRRQIAVFIVNVLPVYILFQVELRVPYRAHNISLDN